MAVSCTMRQMAFLTHYLSQKREEGINPHEGIMFRVQKSSQKNISRTSASNASVRLFHSVSFFSSLPLATAVTSVSALMSTSPALRTSSFSTRSAGTVVTKHRENKRRKPAQMSSLIFELNPAAGVRGVHVAGH